MASSSSSPSTFNEYAAAFPPEVQAVLRQVREAVLRAVPDGQEIISYRMPAVRLHGVLVYFAAFKNHIGFYPPITGDPGLEAAAAPYAGEKGNLRFPLNQPMPLDLIERLTRLRVAQDQAKARSSKRSTAKP
jgi:uncharacterized protein YdhG (YjbR/CyaY superfamily)